MPLEKPPYQVNNQASYIKILLNWFLSRVLLNGFSGSAIARLNGLIVNILKTYIINNGH